jgi:hypothetical protein
VTDITVSIVSGLKGEWHYCEFIQWTEGVTGITVSPVSGLRVDWHYCESCQWT